MSEPGEVAVDLRSVWTNLSVATSKVRAMVVESVVSGARSATVIPGRVLQPLAGAPGAFGRAADSTTSPGG